MTCLIALTFAGIMLWICFLLVWAKVVTSIFGYGLLGFTIYMSLSVVLPVLLLINS